MKPTKAEVKPRPLCIAHRGGPAGNPQLENTLTAIEASILSGADAIEIDVWNIDDHIMVIHDRRLGRLIPGSAIISTLALEELKQAALENAVYIPTLTEVIQLINNRVILNIEIKGPDCSHLVCSSIKHQQKLGNLDASKILISSFDHQQIQQCQKLCPQLKYGVLVYGIPHELGKTAELLGAYFLGVSIDFINKELIADCKRRNIKTWVYTANDKTDFDYLFELSIDGIFTDYPIDLIEKINQE